MSDETPSRGRPSTYDPAYCEQAETFLSDGYSVAALAGFLKVAKSTIYEWIERHPEFSDAVKRGQAGAVYWWETANRNLAITGDGNATACVFGLKNRASDEWRDKTETEHSGNLQITKVTREIVRPADPDR